MGGLLGIEGGASESKDMTPNEFLRLRSPLANELQNIFTGGGAQYGGLFAAPVSETETSLLQYLNAISRGTALDQTITKQISDTASGAYADPNDPRLKAWSDMATRMAREELDQAELENRSLFGRAGQKLQESSPFATAQAITNRSYSNAIGDIETKIFGEAREQERNRQIEAAQTGAVLGQYQWDKALENLKSQGLPRLVADLGIERGLKEWDRFMADIMEALQLAGVMSKPTLGQDQWNFGAKFGTSGGVTE